jgi:myo-inositol-1(or 4)-monophosphatase
MDVGWDVKERMRDEGNGRFAAQLLASMILSNLFKRKFSMTTITQLLDAAEELAVSAGKLVHEKWVNPVPVQSKGFRDVVTEADFAAQALITDTVKSRFPTHGFLTEEVDLSLPAEGDIIWVIDPIDGTINFSRGMPEFCVSVAAVAGGKPLAEILAKPKILACAIYDPMRGELFSAGLGLGGFVIRDGQKRPLSVSRIPSLAEALVTHDWSHLENGRQHILDILNKLVHHVFSVRAVGSAALALAWLAAGRTDLYFNYSLKPWDIAAAQLLLAETGGVITGADGANLIWDVNGMTCLASNGGLHIPYTKLLQG